MQQQRWLYIVCSLEKKKKKKKKYEIGDDRALWIGENSDWLCIEEKGTNKSATFTPVRWASFLLCLSEIDSHVKKLSAGKNVGYRKHYGGGWHVSVTSGYYCVDLRKFYMPPGKNQDCKPCKEGIALRLGEWAMLKKKIGAVKRYNKTVAGFTPCHHTSQKQIKACSECSPFSRSLYNVRSFTRSYVAQWKPTILRWLKTVVSTLKLNHVV